MPLLPFKIYLKYILYSFTGNWMIITYNSHGNNKNNKIKIHFKPIKRLINYRQALIS